MGTECSKIAAPCCCLTSLAHLRGLSTRTRTVNAARIRIPYSHVTSLQSPTESCWQERAGCPGNVPKKISSCQFHTRRGTNGWHGSAARIKFSKVMHSLLHMVWAQRTMGALARMLHSERPTSPSSTRRRMQSGNSWRWLARPVRAICSSPKANSRRPLCGRRRFSHQQRRGARAQSLPRR